MRTPSFATTDEVAKQFRVTRAAVGYWIRSGKLKAIRIGRRWLIDTDDLQAFWGQEADGATSLSD